MIAQRLQQAARESLAEAMIAHTEEPLRRVLRHSRHPERVKELLQDDAVFAEELAYRIRAHSQADLGLAVRAIPDPTRTTQNFSPGGSSARCSEKSCHRHYRAEEDGLDV
jgi:hypothetical protein